MDVNKRWCKVERLRKALQFVEIVYKYKYSAESYLNVVDDFMDGEASIDDVITAADNVVIEYDL